jgi:hypothetical protein
MANDLDTVLALATQAVALAVEPVRVGCQDREVAAVDLIAIQVWWRRWDTEVRGTRGDSSAPVAGWSPAEAGGSWSSPAWVAASWPS